MPDPVPSVPSRPSATTRLSAGAVSRRLPDFPWDSLAEVKARAVAHPDGIVDLSIGTPVDETPAVAREALAAGANAPGYPQTVGTLALRRSAVDWLARRHGVTGLDVDGVLPAIGSKELIAGLALHLGLGPGDAVVIPELAYPTYEVGARLAGCEVVVSDSTVALGPSAPSLMWINSPSNPSGRVLGLEHLRKTVSWARERGVLLVSDECYLECSWDATPSSVLHPDVSGGSHEGVLAVHSLSKRSNLAGYRAAFVAGDPTVIGELLEVRKNLGLIVPAPVQDAMTAALADDAHADAQHAVYAARRATLRRAFEAAGFRIDHSEASLYLWATRGEPARETVRALADLGILVAPGDFYGAAGAEHVRVGFTASDERIAAAATRLSSLA
ncbi:succinyldiaminopimelate transaminase [Mumia sp. zg.B53]|uniref:succinyldiaminopimelate transaminase n=1 Tax=unclassified Mumia TaxID=2621872 RepID=UPI001C6E34CC|nr:MULTISPECIES: succinyldiaminopimelate transaminase [unclassified Mumia]MBW9206802.1 succinyldiaminopimelate transaminase [Mumia sp. zg.B17]MBW9210910.1 succinyldiaminopimelate transaminase [Mumia sp. zg.B21]MBW9215476.1 succinyldiaminopimelate transaminase [Mumia sp. zg.B53]MDD9348815.1 succinyldiaminopimelate transaminase [Mumia sp.]